MAISKDDQAIQSGVMPPQSTRSPCFHKPRMSSCGKGDWVSGLISLRWDKPDFAGTGLLESAIHITRGAKLPQRVVKTGAG